MILTNTIYVIIIKMYRNNFIFTFSNFGNKSEIGIYKKKKSRELIPCEDINIALPKSRIIVRNFLDWLVINDLDYIYDFKTNKGFLHNISVRNNSEDQFMIEIYLKKNNGIREFIDKIKKYNFSNYNITSVYIQIFDYHHNFRDEYEKIYGNDFLDYNFGSKIISIYPGAFFQTNNDVLFTMYKEISSIIDKSTNIFMDLYCGVGVMSLLINGFFNKCYGIEINHNSIQMAKFNAQQNDIRNCDFICSPVEDIVANITRKVSEKVTIFINPPRSGLRQNVIEELNFIKPYVKQIVYLSCSEKTLERDLRLFDYSNTIVKKYNMFIDTGHIETLVILS